jgi:hypothetical protein
MPQKRRRRSRPRRSNGPPPSYRAAHWGLPSTEAGNYDVNEPGDNRKLIGLGLVHSIVYVTRKKGDAGDTEYEHKFSSSDPPLLAYGSDDGRLYFLGGKYRMTVHGIVD